MTSPSQNLSSTNSQQPILLGRYHRGAQDEQPAVKKATAHSSQCACAGCFPDPIR